MAAIYLLLLIYFKSIGGYKVVHMRAKAPVQTLPEFDEALIKDMKLPTVSNRPINSVVQTISE